MDNKILGVLILRDQKDKTESYVEYQQSQIEQVCNEICIIEGNLSYEEAVKSVEERDYDILLLTDTDAFGPVRPLTSILEKFTREAAEVFAIPHFLLIKKGAKVQELSQSLGTSLAESLESGKAYYLPKSFFTMEKSKTLSYGTGKDLTRAMDYIKKSSYDEQLIYQYLVKNCNLAALRDSLNLNYILQEEFQVEPLWKGKKVAVIAHMYYEDLFGYNLRFLRELPEEADLYITTDSEEKEKEINSIFAPIFGARLKIFVVEKRGRELSALLITCRDIPKKYDYFCFIHDKKSAQMGKESVGAEFRDLLWENMLYNENYIHQILNLFEKHQEIGMLIPPNVCHGAYFGTSADYWTICFDKVKEIEARLKLEAQIQREYPPLAIGSVFWCRSEAVLPLFEEAWRYEDFPAEPLPVDGSFSHALERCFPYVAQSQGYLTGVVMTTEAARTELVADRYMLTGAIHAMVDLPVIRLTDYEEFYTTAHMAGNQIYQGDFDPGLKRSIRNFIYRKILKKEIPRR